MTKGRGKRKPKSRAEVIENDISSGSEDLHSKDETNDSTTLDSLRTRKPATEDVEAKKEKEKESEISDLELDEEVDDKKKGKSKPKVRAKKEKKEKEKKEKEETDKLGSVKQEDGKKKKKGNKKVIVLGVFVYVQ